MASTDKERSTDRGNPSKGTGASGGGSFGNQQEAPVTGGAPENGERGSGPVHSSESGVQSSDRAGNPEVGGNRQSG
ncbi:hypothetical protein [Burkholderia sp. WSM2232]|uniref:hypothetical protein n=1 Tax=Burkholderia sp. WSM2232 TaxID=944436 RepID=UPI0004856334|nr:hypothetical protein [Burkholderia sp. WSM2232]